MKSSTPTWPVRIQCGGSRRSGGCDCSISRFADMDAAADQHTGQRPAHLHRPPAGASAQPFLSTPLPALASGFEQIQSPTWDQWLDQVQARWPVLNPTGRNADLSAFNLVTLPSFRLGNETSAVDSMNSKTKNQIQARCAWQERKTT